MTPSIIDTLIKIVLSLAPVAIVFIYYYKNFVFKRSRILALSAFFWGIISCNATILIQYFLPQTNNVWIRSFIYASFLEEFVRYLFVILLVYRSSSHFTITEGIFNAILIGLGFAISENLHYSFRYPGYTILLRTISSVPIHVFLSGIMGYFLSYAYLNHRINKDRKVSKAIYFRQFTTHLLAIAYPVLIHGFYDWSLLSRSKLVFLVPVIIVLIFINLEFLIDIGRSIFGKNILDMLKLSADDVRIILRQQQYEQWVNNRQKKHVLTPFFQEAWKRIPLGIAIFSVLFSLGALYLIITNNPILTRFKDLNPDSQMALFFLYPLTIGIIILIANKINFSFFRIFISHVPQTALVNVQPPDDEDECYSFVMDIHQIGIFLPMEQHWPRDSDLTIEFIKIDKKGNESTLPVVASIRWNNHFNKTMPLGYICHFKKTSLQFYFFRLSYQFKKLLKIPKTYKNLKG